MVVSFMFISLSPAMGKCDTPNTQEFSRLSLDRNREPCKYLQICILWASCK